MRLDLNLTVYIKINAKYKTVTLVEKKKKIFYLEDFRTLD